MICFEVLGVDGNWDDDMTISKFFQVPIVLIDFIIIFIAIHFFLVEILIAYGLLIMKVHIKN